MERYKLHKYRGVCVSECVGSVFYVEVRNTGKTVRLMSLEVPRKEKQQS